VSVHTNIAAKGVDFPAIALGYNVYQMAIFILIGVIISDVNKTKFLRPRPE